MVGRQNPQGNIGPGPGSGKVLAQILLIAGRASCARSPWERVFPWCYRHVALSTQYCQGGTRDANANSIE